MLPLQKILCPVDFSEPSLVALTKASQLAARFASELYVLHVIPFSPQVPADLVVIAMSSLATDQERREEALRHLNEVIAQRVDLSVQVQPLVKMGYAANEIVCVAEDESMDLIVLATQGHSGWRHLVFGSVAESVLHMTPCPVLTLRPLDASAELLPSINGSATKGSPLSPQTILCPVDFSESSLVALDAASEWAKYFGARLDVLHVVPTISQEISAGEYAAPEYNRIWLDANHRKLCDLVTTRLPHDLESHPIVCLGDAAAGIDRAAHNENADIIVLSTHGYSGWRHLMLGSVTEQLLRTTHCPLLVIRTTNTNKADAKVRFSPLRHTSDAKSSL